MSLPKLILALVDPAMRQTAATRRAVELTRRCGARLHLMMVAFDARIDATAELVDPEVERLARERFIEQRLRWLAEWTAGLVAQSLRITCEVVWAKAMHEAVIVKVLEMQPDLVITDLHHETFLRRWSAIRSSDWRLARLCPAPLMLVQPDATMVPALVAAAVDPAHPLAHSIDLDQRIVQAALPLAMACGAAIEMVHVFPHRQRDEGLSAKLDELIEQLRRDDSAAFRAFADSNSVPPESRLLLEGDPVVELLRYTERRDVGLLVIGSLYRSGLDRLLLGSHAEALVAQAGCDLLLIRPADFGLELTRHRVLDAMQERMKHRQAA